MLLIYINYYIVYAHNFNFLFADSIFRCNFALENYKRAPALIADTHYFLRAKKHSEVQKDETVMLNITGGGMLNATRKGFTLKEPDLVLSPELSAEEIIMAVDKLF